VPARPIRAFDTASAVRDARAAAGLSQRRLAALASTSQATIANYERGRKEPSVATLARLLAACGQRLRPAAPPRVPTDVELRRAGELLSDVLTLAEALPFSRRGGLRYPRLPGPAR
jgi:transcriptional regulator with XRE-family HTH domain